MATCCARSMACGSGLSSLQAAMTNARRAAVKILIVITNMPCDTFHLDETVDEFRLLQNSLQAAIPTLFEFSTTRRAPKQGHGSAHSSADSLQPTNTEHFHVGNTPNLRRGHFRPNWQLSACCASGRRSWARRKPKLTRQPAKRRRGTQSKFRSPQQAPVARPRWPFAARLIENCTFI